MSGIYSESASSTSGADDEDGHLLEFPLIRVDCFTTQRPGDVWLLPDPQVPAVTRPAPVAQLHLLSHVHTDHLVGLENSFTSRIVCHPDTKRMLLRLEAERDRRNLHEGKTELVKRKYAGLVARRQVHGHKEHWVDMIVRLLKLASASTCLDGWPELIHARKHCPTAFPRNTTWDGMEMSAASCRSHCLTLTTALGPRCEHGFPFSN